MKPHEIRRENLRKIAEKLGGLSKIGEILGRNRSQMSHIIGPNPVRGIGENLAREIEIALKLKSGYLDTQVEEKKNGIINDDEVKTELTNIEIINKIGVLILDSDKANMSEKYEILKEIERRLQFYY